MNFSKEQTELLKSDKVAPRTDSHAPVRELNHAHFTGIKVHLMKYAEVVVLIFSTCRKKMLLCFDKRLPFTKHLMS